MSGELSAARRLGKLQPTTRSERAREREKVGRKELLWLTHTLFCARLHKQRNRSLSRTNFASLAWHCVCELWRILVVEILELFQAVSLEENKALKI